MQEPEQIDEDEMVICDECHHEEGHARGCPWGDDTDTDYDLVKDREIGAD